MYTTKRCTILHVRALATSIIYQQISGKAGASIRRKFIQLFDPPLPLPEIVTFENLDWFPTPEMVTSKSVEELRPAGLSARKVRNMCF